MMDALAADRMMGESLPNAWAFGDCEPGKEGEKTDEWSSKGVSPILYSVEKGSTDHSMLHGTLHNWSETYRDGVNGKERIIVKYASAQPGASTKQDDYAGQVLWAITDESGLPAKRFAETNPAPSLDWLIGVFGTRVFENKDLSRFGVKSIDELNNKFSFTLIDRPAPYHFSPSMSFANRGQFDTGWDDVFSQLSNWLVRHLNDPQLVEWIVKCGGQIHERLARTVDRELNKIHGLEREGNVTELERIRTESPNAIPSRMMRTLWGMIVNGRLKSPERDLDLSLWKKRFIRDGLTFSLRQELREILSPKVAIRGLPMWNRQTDVDKEPIRLKQIVDWELVLNAEESSSILLDIADDRWKAAIPSLLPDFQQLLRDALDMLREFGEADDKQDRSFMELPSVEPHQQNSRFQELGTLIELVRDSWVEFRKTDVERSNRIAQDWFETPYAAFKRLAFFAASRNDCISSEQWIQWLLMDDAWWLWSEETRREVLRLLVLQGVNLEEKAQSLLDCTLPKPALFSPLNQA
ncbi:hypothetical protein FGO68_gene13595 [Halteria grandinella]|uniref:Uncharacterized protein n=1 Tax=Halteria grandinella TaxID=5974 RepID=A0A8J8NA64_HALGN|nr:hypothetical protein FGO68_gene13595 [Halteria grandinella]